MGNVGEGGLNLGGGVREAYDVGVWGDLGYVVVGGTRGDGVREGEGVTLGGGGGVREELVKNAVCGQFLEIYYILKNYYILAAAG